MFSILQPLKHELGFEYSGFDEKEGDSTTREYVSPKRQSLRDIPPDRSFHKMPTEQQTEITMPFIQCPYKVPEYLAIGMFPFLTGGLVLTSISVYVYTRPAQLKTTIGYLLACLSISEWLFLLTALNCFSLSRIPLFTCSHDPDYYSQFKAYSDVYVYPFAHITKYMCVCISILISVQQWIAVFVPMKVKTWCSMKRTKRLIFVSAVVSIFLATPKFFELTINKFSGRPKPDKTWKGNLLFELIEYFNDYIFNAFIIFFILFVINISIICLLKWSQHERMRMTTQNMKDCRTSMMLLAVLLSYVLTHFPSMMIEYSDKFLESNLPLQIRDVRKELSVGYCSNVVCYDAPVRTP